MTKQNPQKVGNKCEIKVTVPSRMNTNKADKLEAEGEDKLRSIRRIVEIASRRTLPVKRTQSFELPPWLLTEIRVTRTLRRVLTSKKVGPLRPVIYRRELKTERDIERMRGRASTKQKATRVSMTRSSDPCCSRDLEPTPVRPSNLCDSRDTDRTSESERFKDVEQSRTRDIEPKTHGKNSPRDPEPAKSRTKEPHKRFQKLEPQPDYIPLYESESSSRSDSSDDQDT